MNPREEYRQRLEARCADERRCARADGLVANWRVALFVAGLSVAAAAFGFGWVRAWLILVPAVAFFVLVVHHDRVIHRRQRARRAAEFYEQALARLEHTWAGRGVTGERFLDPEHPYAIDLDLFGRGSLFELLCTARTVGGEATLAAWLLSPADAATVVARQQAVAELAPRLALREDLWLLGGEVRGALEPDHLLAWASVSPSPAPHALRVATALLAGAAVVAAVAWALGFSGWPFFWLFIAEQTLALALFPRTGRALQGVSQAARELTLFAGLLARIEAEPIEAPLLRTLRARLAQGGLPPSRRIAQLDRLVQLLDSQRSIFFAPFALVLLWATQFAFAIEAWRAAHGGRLAEWLAIVGEFETLCALAGYAGEHPADPFPELSAEGPAYAAVAVGHPLLPDEACVRNDVRLGPGTPRLLIISGSNMSGKSTLLRTVGANTVLALAGAPVRAARLQLSPLAIGASLRTQDSLQSGTSRFYAEIRRLRQIVDLTGDELPVLFLLDEVLHGTNSHDRRIGAEAVLRTLVRRGAIGLVTTHDLALTRIVEAPALQAINAHFQDHLEDGRMTFDYRLQPGVVEKSNALALMRAVGLDVTRPTEVEEGGAEAGWKGGNLL